MNKHLIFNMSKEIIVYKTHVILFKFVYNLKLLIKIKSFIINLYIKKKYN